MEHFYVVVFGYILRKNSFSVEEDQGVTIVFLLPEFKPKPRSNSDVNLSSWTQGKSNFESTRRGPWLCCNWHTHFTSVKSHTRTHSALSLSALQKWKRFKLQLDLSLKISDVLHSPRCDFSSFPAQTLRSVHRRIAPKVNLCLRKRRGGKDRKMCENWKQRLTGSSVFLWETPWQTEVC